MPPYNNNTNLAPVVQENDDEFENEVIDLQNEVERGDNGGSIPAVYEMNRRQYRRRLVVLGIIAFITFWLLLAILTPSSNKNKNEDVTANQQPPPTQGSVGSGSGGSNPSSTPGAAPSAGGGDGSNPTILISSPSSTIITEYPAPTRAPQTIGPTTTKFVRLVNLLQPILYLDGDAGNVFDDANTNQYRAIDWLLNSDGSGSIDVDLTTLIGPAKTIQIIQRYIAVLFYYTTNGENWNEDINFLSTNDHVCKWNNNDVGIFCDAEDNDVISKLLFGKFSNVYFFVPLTSSCVWPHSLMPPPPLLSTLLFLKKK